MLYYMECGRPPEKILSRRGEKWRWQTAHEARHHSIATDQPLQQKPASVHAAALVRQKGGQNLTPSTGSPPPGRPPQRAPIARLHGQNLRKTHTYVGDAVQVGQESPELVAHAVLHLDLPLQLGALLLCVGAGHAQEALETLHGVESNRYAARGAEVNKAERCARWRSCTGG